jgi:membrane associated rhomboid family serine protease
VTDEYGTNAVETQNHCYRHPDREAYVKCQRCGRTICGECQTPAAVGFHCPECMRESRQQVAATRGPIAARVGRMFRSGQRPMVTYVLIALNLVIYAVQYFGDQATKGAVTDALVYVPELTTAQPWRIVTSIFAHESILHVGLNMYSLFIVGPALEQMLGKARYIVLYLVAGLAGSVGVLLIAAPNQPVLGASGAIFGLFGAFFIIARRLGGNYRQMLVLIVLNLVAGFIPGLNIAWQAHVGGLVGGAAIALVYLETRGPRRRTAQILLVAAVVVALVVASVAKIELAGY